MPEFTVYILRCSDGDYYVGIADDLPKRVEEHNLGLFRSAYTYLRRPVELVYEKTFTDLREAIRWQKELGRWSKKRKEALVLEKRKARTPP